MRPALLGVPVRLLGQPVPPFIVRVEDQDMRPLPGVPIERTIVETGERETFDLGPEGVGEIPAGARAGAAVVLRPAVSLNFASSPAFADMEAGDSRMITFAVNPRRQERDLVTPIVTFVMGGVASFIVLSLIKDRL